MKQRFTKRTRLVSALLTLAMVFTFLPFSAFAAGTEVAINATNFPDPAFLEFVKQYDKNGNDVLSEEERNLVYILDVRNSGIKELTGIKWFPKLHRLNCIGLGLKELNLSQNKELVTLDCSENNLTQLELSQNAELTYLDCSENKLTQLNLPSSAKLEKLICYDNQLSALDVNSLGYLTNLSCGKNPLGTLDVSNLTLLKSLACYENGLTALNVENNSYLKDLSCGGNQLTVLDLSHNPNLTELYCSDNQLSRLDLRQNKELTTLQCFQNKLEHLDVSQSTKLQAIQCADNQLTSLDVTKNKALKELDCARNQLVELDTRNNAALEKLNCESNRLAGLNLDDNLNLYLANISVGNNVYPAEMKSDRTVDLSKFPNRFDVERTSFWYGGTRQGNILTVKEGVTKVRYKYDYKGSLTEDFYLDVSGTGGSTGGGSTGGGSTGGGSTGGGTPGGSTGGGTIPPEAGKYQLTVTDGVATVNGITSDVLNVKPGDTVTLTADTTKFPENEEFGWWEITPYGSVSNTLTGQYQRTATFTMPNENVSARAMSKSAGVSTGGDDGGGGGGAAILLVGGAAVAGLVGYGVYSYVSEQQLKALLPEGVAMPENRAQTALLLWNTAGRPEPAEAPAFKDVADPDTAKAAQWCVEHGLMDRKLGGRFAPDNSDPVYKTLNAYQQLVG